MPNSTLQKQSISLEHSRVDRGPGKHGAYGGEVSEYEKRALERFKIQLRDIHPGEVRIADRPRPLARAPGASARKSLWRSAQVTV